MGTFQLKESGLYFRHKKETIWFQPYGDNGVRVRATENKSFELDDWALLPGKQTKGNITLNEQGASLVNGKLRVEISSYGKIRFYNHDNKLLLKEYYRTNDRGVDFTDADNIDQYVFIHQQARTYHASGNNYQLSLRFEPNDNERIYGMGQYQQPYLDLKGCLLELAQLNSQASVPFAISSAGYGFLWNNPGVGRVNFGKNITKWVSDNSPQFDYWITAGDSPSGIIEDYAKVTGTVPIMPEYGLGFWQSKLRYRTQDELLSVARKYYRRKIPLKVIVADFFHWTNQGEWRFDKEFWPNPKAMVEELETMGIKLMVSVWPTVDSRSPNYKEMSERDLLVRADKGIEYTMELMGFEGFTDMTNPEARDYIWEKCKENYFKYGIELFWLDVAEPEYTALDFDIYRYHAGPVQQVGNVYPLMYAKAFYEGLSKSGVAAPMSLIRCAWAGSQRYGALAWSGDVPSSFTYLRNQITAGLSIGLAGIPWWASDIGGFHGKNPEDVSFRELMIRWFQFGTFSPVMRLHGDRLPHTPGNGRLGGGLCGTGAGNEIWSFGEEAEKIMTCYIHIREKLKPYISEAMKEAHEKGTPVIKPLFYDYPEDENTWSIEDAYLFGHDLIVAPIYRLGERERTVYLPFGQKWINIQTNEVFAGGQTILVQAPLDTIPLFSIEGSEVIGLIQK